MTSSSPKIFRFSFQILSSTQSFQIIQILSFYPSPKYAYFFQPSGPLTSPYFSKCFHFSREYAYLIQPLALLPKNFPFLAEIRVFISTPSHPRPTPLLSSFFRRLKSPKDYPCLSFHPPPIRRDSLPSPARRTPAPHPRPCPSIIALPQPPPPLHASQNSVL